MNYNGNTIRQLERESIRAWVDGCSPYLAGDVLDFGCGTQPYKGIVQAAGGAYHPYDRCKHPGSVTPRNIGPAKPLERNWHAILCNQVIQYIPDVPALLRQFRAALQKHKGWLVLTGPGNWPEVEPADLFRFTKEGIQLLLAKAGFRNLQVENRAVIDIDCFHLPVGWGALGQA